MTSVTCYTRVKDLSLALSSSHIAQLSLMTCIRLEECSNSKSEPNETGICPVLPCCQLPKTPHFPWLNITDDDGLHSHSILSLKNETKTKADGRKVVGRNKRTLLGGCCIAHRMSRVNKPRVGWKQHALLVWKREGLQHKEIPLLGNYILHPRRLHHQAGRSLCLHRINNMFKLTKSWDDVITFERGEMRINPVKFRASLIG